MALLVEAALAAALLAGALLAGALLAGALLAGAAASIERISPAPPSTVIHRMPRHR
jgi:hypothetical protein